MKTIYDIKHFEPRKSVGFLMHRARSEILAALDRELGQDTELAPLEISAAQYIILNSLMEQDVDSTSRLCKQMSYDPGAMTRMVDRLEAKGLIQRRRCPNDRRLVNLELTDAGREAVPKMRACSVTVLNRFLRGFSVDEVRQLESFLIRIYENK
jgi:MarR family transcriptional regulator, multiple antibiotic resistance protein MarR